MFIIEPHEPRILLTAMQAGSIITIHGTPANDVIQLWSNANDLIVRDNGVESAFSLYGLKLIRIYGERGDDTITALPGSEPLTIRLSIDAGAGNDSITGGAGNDTTVGEMGNDTITGGGGDDFVDYRYIDDRGYWSAVPQSGATVNLSTGLATEPAGFTDTINGIHGVIGSQEWDSITGTDANDTLMGMGGGDTIHGGGGNDLIRGGSGADKLFGDTGNDTILGDVGPDVIHGGGGADVLSGGREGEKNIFDQSDYAAGHVVDFEPGIDVLE